MTNLADGADSEYEDEQEAEFVLPLDNQKKCLLKQKGSVILERKQK